ncbi:NGFI-A-binding protein 1-like [Dysidea avara]|uniref:NGFI-A-binding protein 1-like n=1 Tax=Dysidea avara TaxID=196820 RepID=UPI0033174FC4
MSTLHSLLEAANLLAYEDALLEQGADDVGQLRELNDTVLDQICDIVGLSKKPLHLLRFKKALNKDASTLPPPTTVNSSFDSQLRFQQPSVTTIKATQESLPSQMRENSTVFLPACIKPGAATSNFDELVDDQTPIQVTLGPAPLTPEIWDAKRMEIIRSAASIYGRSSRANKRKSEGLTVYELNVNEAATQLCLRDPTLLIRRDELLTLSRRAVKQGGFNYAHGFSRSKDTMPLQVVVPPNTGRAREDPVTARVRRLARMSELEEMISKNKAEQAVKIRALEEAQVAKDYPAVHQYQTLIESLGNACMRYQSEMNTLMKRQKRSDRYFNDKAKKKAMMEMGPNIHNMNTLQHDKDDDDHEASEDSAVDEETTTSVVYVTPVDAMQQPVSTSPSGSPSSPPTTVVTYQPTSIFQVAVPSQPAFQNSSTTDYSRVSNSEILERVNMAASEAAFSLVNMNNPILYTGYDTNAT